MRKAINWDTRINWGATVKYSNSKLSKQLNFPVVRIPFQIQKYTMIHAKNKHTAILKLTIPGFSIPELSWRTLCLKLQRKGTY